MSAATPSRSHAAVPPPAVLRLLLARSLADWRSWALCAAAYALVGGLLISIVAGVAMYWSHDYAEPAMRMIYRTLASVALCILGLPLVQLAGAAAKLSARRRDARLSGLRLLGAGRATLHALVVGEAALQAVVGLLVGLVIYAVLIPVLGGLHVDGTRIGAAAMVLPAWVIALCFCALLGLAVLASMAGLRRVSITPLAVRTRRDAPSMGAWRVVIAVVLLLVVVLGSRAALMLGAGEIILAVIISAMMFGIPMLAMTLLGPWAISVSARRMHRRAQSPQRLLAARMLLEDPRAAWRQLQSVVLLAFVAVTVGAGLTLMSSAAGEPGIDHLVEDMRTGALLTVLYGFFAAACAVLIDQAAGVEDRWQVWFGLHRLGMPVEQIDSARRLAVMRPLWVLLAIAVGTTALAQAPMLGVGLLVSPQTLMAVVVVLGCGAGMIPLALRSTRPALRRRAEQGC